MDCTSLAAFSNAMVLTPHTLRSGGFEGMGTRVQATLFRTTRRHEFDMQEVSRVCYAPSDGDDHVK